jgi:dephospho-CoA kinase
MVGLTGNYGMGKSSVLAMFENLGAITIDSDSIVHSLLVEKDILEKIRELLGETVFDKDGGLIKPQVAQVIFTNSELRKSLEKIIHPRVFEKIDLFLNNVNGKQKVAVISIPLLFEGNYERRFDRIITVFAKEETTLKRLELRGISKEEALLRLEAQIPIEEKVKRSDFVIDNNGSLEDTMLRVREIYTQLIESSVHGNN